MKPKELLNKNELIFSIFLCICVIILSVITTQISPFYEIKILSYINIILWSYFLIDDFHKLINIDEYNCKIRLLNNHDQKFKKVIEYINFLKSENIILKQQYKEVNKINRGNKKC